MDEETITFNEETGEIVDEERPRGRRQTKDEDAPVDNADELPLFPEAHYRTKRSIQYIEVTKLTSPAEGFKGKMGPNSDRQTIASKWGNGTYLVEGVNAKGKALRRAEITIALEDDPNEGKNGDEQPDKFAKLALQAQHATHQKEVDRIQALSEQVSGQIRQQGEQYVDMVTKTQLAAAERDRAYHKTQQTQMGEFFSSMFAQSQQQHQQAVAMMQAGHQQTMQMMQALNVQSAQMNNPATLMGVLVKGLELGQGLNADNEEPWVAGIKAGGDTLGKMLELAKMDSAKTAVPPAQPPARKLPPPEERSFTRTEVQKIADFKALCDRKGIPIEELIAQAESQVSALPDAPFEDEDESDEEPDTSTDATENKQPNVGDEEHSKPDGAT
jgi:hypothetical protein